MSLEAVSSLIAAGLFIGLMAYLVMPILWHKETVAKLKLPNGHEYTYVVGDYMRSYGKGGSFNGIDVALPRELPHIYLDTLRGAGRRAQFVIDRSQYIQLEGNFNKTYRVFVPKKYEVLALSILSPDVMATIQDHASAFDVEIYGSHVRVISHKRVMPSQERQADVLAIALKIMQEVDHRLQSWSKADSMDALNQDLLFYPASGFRIFGRSLTYRSIWMGLYWFLVTIGLGVTGLFVLTYPELRILGIILIVFFVLLFVGFMVMSKVGLHRSRFRSRH